MGLQYISEPFGVHPEPLQKEEWGHDLVLAVDYPKTMAIAGNLVCKILGTSLGQIANHLLF